MKMNALPFFTIRKNTRLDNITLFLCKSESRVFNKAKQRNEFILTTGTVSHSVEACRIVVAHIILHSRSAPSQDLLKTS